MGGDVGLSGEKRHLVAISDVHLGTASPTVWFQPAVHEAHLLRLLRWVVDQAPHIRELVLLGDIVDLWTYPTDVVPPSFAEIVAAHPAVLGPDGALAEVLDALDGAVTYVPGNHDQGVTAEEVSLLRSRSGHHVRLVEDLPHLPDPRVALAHGHHFTLFNAPATVGPWAPLPLGYFVTRVVASRWAHELADGATVADLADQGAPNGIDLTSLRSVVAGAGARSVAASLVDFVCSACNVSLDEPILMPDGSSTTMRQARAVYADCWSDWAIAEGGGLAGTAAAFRAALADFDGTYLEWYAQRLALQHGADLVVMGHTHIPIGGLGAGLVEYLNTGFDCPSSPDQARTDRPQQVTFGVVDLGEEPDDEPKGRVWAVDDAVHPIDAPRTKISHGPNQDRSCYVVVDNTAGPHDLELVEAVAHDGHHVVPPPDRIPAGTEARFWLQDHLGPAGSSGAATYRRAGAGDDAPLLELRYACPTVGTNRASGTHSLATAVGDGDWRNDRVLHWGHPFFVAFEVG